MLTLQTQTKITIKFLFVIRLEMLLGMGQEMQSAKYLNKYHLFQYPTLVYAVLICYNVFENITSLQFGLILHLPTQKHTYVQLYLLLESVWPRRQNKILDQFSSLNKNYEQMHKTGNFNPLWHKEIFLLMLRNHQNI